MHSGPGQLTDRRLQRRWRGLAVGWLAVIAIAAVDQWQFWQHPRLNSDVLALLPGDAGPTTLAEAAYRIGDAESRRIVAMLGAGTPAAVQTAAEAYRRTLGGSAALLREVPGADAWFALARDFYAPWRDRLLPLVSTLVGGSALIACWSGLGLWASVQLARDYAALPCPGSSPSS